MKKYFFLLGVCIALGSCSTGDTAPTTAAIVSNLFTGGSSHALVFLECRAASENEIQFDFSHPVSIKDLSFNPELAVSEIESGSTVKVTLEEIPEPGVLITADLIAEDSKRNSINVIVNFRTRNNRMPKLVINELRTEYSKPKYEFIELKMLTSGNLGAVRLFIASNPKSPMVYEFLPVEVNQNDYVVVHIRTTEEGCIDEYGINLSESSGTDSSSKARDLWIPTNTELLRKTDAVYLLDQDNEVLDAIMFSENAVSWWDKEYLAQAAEFLFSKNAWTADDGNICSPSKAVRSAGTTATRTICRDETSENSNTAAEWYICYQSNATPGEKNSEKRYTP